MSVVRIQGKIDILFKLISVLALILLGLNFVSIESLRRNSISSSSFSKPGRNISRYNISFIESNAKREFLSTQQLCAIESAARNNLNAMVNIYTFSAEIGNHSFLLDQYPNLKLIKTSGHDFFNNTPLFEWYKNGPIQKSPFKMVHSANAARILLLKKARLGLF